MSGPMSQNNQILANWWGYGMPPKLSTINSGLPRVFDAAGKAPTSLVTLVSSCAKDLQSEHYGF